jgi:hypothetical protein
MGLTKNHQMSDQLSSNLFGFANSLCVLCLCLSVLGNHIISGGDKLPSQINTSH